jgi:hypothetical protein
MHLNRVGTVLVRPVYAGCSFNNLTRYSRGIEE